MGSPGAPYCVVTDGSSYVYHRSFLSELNSFTKLMYERRENPAEKETAGEWQLHIASQEGSPQLPR
jgi:hypothetical protein